MSGDGSVLEKRLLMSIFIGIFLIVLICTSLTPMLADDYSYSFSYMDRSRIGSLSDILSSLTAHRDSMNGRLIAHFFTHLFLLLPKSVFNFVNAAVFTLIQYTVYRWVCGSNKKTNLFLVLSAFFLLWLFVPVFGQVFFWLDGACNYSWGLCFILLFLSPYFSRYLKKDFDYLTFFWQKLLYIILAFLAGAYSESASFAMLFIATTFLFCIYCREKLLPKLLVVALIAAVLGYIFLMTAPSEWSGRVGSFSIEVMAKNIKRIISAPYDTMLPLFILYAGLLSACICLKLRKEIIITSVILFLGAWASLLLFAAALYFPWRSLLMMTVLLVIACLLMVSALCDVGFRCFLPTATAVIGMVFVFQLVLGIGDIVFVSMQYHCRESAIYQAIEAGENSVGLDTYAADTKYSAAYLLPDIYEDSSLWPNYDLAAYYGIGSVYALPGHSLVE